MASTPIPIACTLNAHDGRVQALEWTGLQGHALRTTALSTGVHMVFPARLATQIADLVEREAACCAFLDFGTTHTDGEVAITITSDDTGAQTVIAALSGVDLS